MLKECKAAIENLMKALESGQNMDIISDRITQKRTECMQLEKSIAAEKLKHVTLTESEIQFFLTKLRSGDINDLQRRRALIHIFVNSVYLYDDKLVIFFNASDNPVTVDAELLKEVAKNRNATGNLYSSQCGSP